MRKKKWFIERIGKKIYRNKDNCKCKTCAIIVEFGLTISDKEHADYLYTLQNDFFAEGLDLNYRDKKIY